jgi:putative transposase
MKADRDVLTAVVTALQRQRSEGAGRLPDGVLTGVAELTGVPKSTLSRWVTQGLPAPQRPMPRFSLEDDEEALAVIYDVNHSRAAAHRRLVQERGAENVPSERTIQRAFRALTIGQQHGVERGDPGWRSHRPVQRYEPEYRNQHWQADHTCLEIYVQPGKGRKPVRPWLTTFIDCYSRAIMGYCVSLRPNQGHVLAGLRSAVRLYSDRGPFCGVPAWVTTDRGMEFVADAVIEALVLMRVTAMPTLPRHPQNNGKAERLHQTITSVFLADLPGFLDGAKDLKKQPLAGNFVLPLDVFLEQLARWIDHYNLERPHKTLDGGTPAEIFEADPTPLSIPSDELLRRYLLKGMTRVVRRGVVWFAGNAYIGRGFREGETVEIRVDPNDLGAIETYRGDSHLCTAEMEERATPEQIDAWVQSNQEDAERHAKAKSRARKRSRRRYAAMVDSRPSVETTTVPAGARTSTATRRRHEARNRALDKLS